MKYTFVRRRSKSLCNATTTTQTNKKFVRAVQLVQHETTVAPQTSRKLQQRRVAKFRLCMDDWEFDGDAVRFYEYGKGHRNPGDHTGVNTVNSVKSKPAHDTHTQIPLSVKQMTTVILQSQ
jgi:hypothetical protein